MENVRTNNELKQLQSLPLEIKIQKSKLRIKEWYDYWNGQVYLSFSGGKDSTVLKHLIENTVGVTDVPNVFVDTGLEYPEIRNFALSQSNVVRLKPKMNFREVIDKYGYLVISKEVSQKVSAARNNPNGSYAKRFDPNSNHNIKYKQIYSMARYKYLLDAPFKISNRCCDIMKKNPAKKYEKETGRKPFVATMTEESQLRKSTWLKHGCNAFQSTRPISSPISFWTEQDIFNYIILNNLSISKVYGDIQMNEYGKYYTTGVNRTGCIFCLAGVQKEKQPNKIQMLSITHPKIYEYCLKSKFCL